jgi:hypothetical protein
MGRVGWPHDGVDQTMDCFLIINDKDIGMLEIMELW